jgi:hypothetical protein
MTKIKLGTILIALFISSLTVCAQDRANKNVYMVIGSNHPQRSGKVIQTGFQLKGVKGVITTLHGILGWTSIAAINEKGGSFLNLTISQVDLDNDLALLTSQELLAKPQDGLQPLNGPMPAAGQELIAYGHPLGVEQLTVQHVRAGRPVLAKLQRLLPANSMALFEKRNSPSTSIQVLNIDGSLAAGTSGGPITDAQQSVVAIIEGGLSGGGAISWAIPIQFIQWRNALSEQGRLRELAKSDYSSNLFSYQETPKPQDKGNTDNKSITASDFGEFSEMTWQRPISGTFLLINNVRKFRVVSLNDCNLVLEQFVKVSTPNIPPVNRETTDKITITTTIPLGKVDAEKSKIDENQNETLAPAGKWGVYFSTSEKEIDSEFVDIGRFEDLRPDEEEKQPKELRRTVSDDNFFVVIGTRKEAASWFELVKRAMKQCHTN